MFKFLIDKMVLNPRWSSWGEYMIPKTIIYSQTIGRGIGGKCSYNPFSCTIKLHPKYKNDSGILKHEQAHARQYGRLFWIHSTLGMISKRYRLLIELECYREQVKAYNYTDKSEYEWIVIALRDKYNLGIPEASLRLYVDYTFKDLIEEAL